MSRLEWIPNCSLSVRPRALTNGLLHVPIVAILRRQPDILISRFHPGNLHSVDVTNALRVDGREERSRPLDQFTSFAK